MSKMINCPCENCRYYTYGKQHPNPNAYDEHYCERLHKPINQHRGNTHHYSGQWIIPCGFEKQLFQREDELRELSKKMYEYATDNSKMKRMKGW